MTILPVVLRRLPPITRSYSWPRLLSTSMRAACMARLFSEVVKSTNSSFAKGVCAVGTGGGGREAGVERRGGGGGGGGGVGRSGEFSGRKRVLLVVVVFWLRVGV